jgi:hypothetical protein
MHKLISHSHKQEGAVLMISVVMLVVIGLLTVSLMGMSRMQVRMSTNEEVRLNALQSAQSSNEAIIGNPATTPVIGGSGYKLCTAGVAVCDKESLIMPTAEMTALVSDGLLTAVAFRGDPEFRNPPRGTGWSLDKFTSTTFTIESTFDGTEHGQSTAEIEEGLVIMLPL